MDEQSRQINAILMTGQKKKLYFMPTSKQQKRKKSLALWEVQGRDHPDPKAFHLTTCPSGNSSPC
jgi:hypothetical protein